MGQAQGALSWQLRTLTTLCRLWPDERELGAQLRATLQQFHEALELADLEVARSVLRSRGGSTRLPSQQAVHD